MTKLFRQFQSASDELNRVQKNVLDAVGDLPKIQIIDGVLVEGIVLNSSSGVNVSHKLGRKPVGFIVVLASTNAMYWNGAITESNINIFTSNAVTVSIWFF